MGVISVCKSVLLEIKVVKNNMEYIKRRKEIRNIMELIVIVGINYKGKYIIDRRCFVNIIIIVMKRIEKNIINWKIE